MVPSCEVGKLGMNCLNTGTGTGGNLAWCLFENKSEGRKYGLSEVTTPFKIKIVDDIQIWFKEIKLCHAYFLI